MPQEPAAQALTRDAARAVSRVLELLDIPLERVRATADPAPVSTSQLQLLCLVDRDDGIRMRALGQLLDTAPSSVSRLCDRLQTMGLLERRPCPHSRREVVLRLTGAGKSHLEAVRTQRETALLHVIGSLPSTERRALAKGLTALHTALCAATDTKARS